MRSVAWRAPSQALQSISIRGVEIRISNKPKIAAEFSIRKVGVLAPVEIHLMSAWSASCDRLGWTCCATSTMAKQKELGHTPDHVWKAVKAALDVRVDGAVVIDPFCADKPDGGNHLEADYVIRKRVNAFTQGSTWCKLAKVRAGSGRWREGAGGAKSPMNTSR